MIEKQHQLIDFANDINEWRIHNASSDVVDKELKKIELYIRKTYIMLVQTNKLMEDDHSEDTFMKELAKALARDFNYVKVRDSMDTYTIDA